MKIIRNVMAEFWFVLNTKGEIVHIFFHYDNAIAYIKEIEYQEATYVE